MSVMYNFVSSTGYFNIVTVEVLEHIHAFVGNTGHFGYEIDPVVSEGLECKKVDTISFQESFRLLRWSLCYCVGFRPTVLMVTRMPSVLCHRGRLQDHLLQTGRTIQELCG